MQLKRPITEIIAVKVKVTNGGVAKMYFPEDKYLANKKIHAIEVIGTDIAPITPLGENVVSNLEGSFLTIAEGSVEKISDIPLNSLRPSLQNGLVKEFEPFLMNFQKSFVSSQSGLNDGDVFFFLFYTCK